MKETKKKLILVAEDDKFYANIYKTKLAKEGFDTVIVGNGQEALQFVQKERPDLILLDLIMPVKDGFDTLSELKNSKDFSSIKVLVLSNLGQDEDIERVKELKADGYLVKTNTSIVEMVEKVKQILVK